MNTHINIHSSDSDFLHFGLPYRAKRLLDDSVTRTLSGYNSFGEGAPLSGCGNILLARVESVAAFAFAALSSVLSLVLSITITPLFLTSITVLNLASRIPGISSFESVQNFTRDSSSVIYRILRVHLIAIPVIFLFLTASTINTFLPGILGPQNIFFISVHWMVEPLGQLKTIRAVVPGAGYFGTDVSIVGTKENISMLEAAEEYFRALSCQNYLRKETVCSASVITKSVLIRRVK